MFVHVVLLLVCVTVSLAKFAENADSHFQEFKSKFGRRYASPEEETKRFALFKQAMTRVDLKNLQNGSPAFGITKFSDWSVEEFSVLLGRKNFESKIAKQVSVRKPEEAAKFGRTMASPTGIIDFTYFTTPVKNQGQCGTCWAFSAAEAIESQWAMDGNAIWEFSSQQIASCTSTCNGCGGGDTPDAYEYLQSVVGLGSAWYAPYQESMYETCLNKRCTYKCDHYNLTALETYSSLTGPYAVVTGYNYATEPCTGLCKGTKQNTTELAINVATYGPPSVCVNAANWNDYTGGVLTQAACGGYAARDLDHCVQLVGYNTEAEQPYWIVRNSWATNWGIDGYIYLEYPANTCGVANEATFVTLGNSQQSFVGNKK